MPDGYFSYPHLAEDALIIRYRFRSLNPAGQGTMEAKPLTPITRTQDGDTNEDGWVEVTRETTACWLTGEAWWPYQEGLLVEGEITLSSDQASTVNLQSPLAAVIVRFCDETGKPLVRRAGPSFPLDGTGPHVFEVRIGPSEVTPGLELSVEISSGLEVDEPARRRHRNRRFLVHLVGSDPLFPIQNVVFQNPYQFFKLVLPLGIEVDDLATQASNKVRLQVSEKHPSWRSLVACLGLAEGKRSALNLMRAYLVISLQEWLLSLRQDSEDVFITILEEPSHHDWEPESLGYLLRSLAWRFLGQEGIEAIRSGNTIPLARLTQFYTGDGNAL